MDVRRMSARHAYKKVVQDIQAHKGERELAAAPYAFNVPANEQHRVSSPHGDVARAIYQVWRTTLLLRYYGTAATFTCSFRLTGSLMQQKRAYVILRNQAAALNLSRGEVTLANLSRDFEASLVTGNPHRWRGSVEAPAIFAATLKSLSEPAAWARSWAFYAWQFTGLPEIIEPQPRAADLRVSDPPCGKSR